MRAAIFYGERDVRIEEIPLPTVGAGEVLVEIRAAGICGSDLHRYRGYEPWGDRVVYPHPAGHEIAGVIAQLGPGVQGLTIGQPVAIEPMQLAGCGACPACERGAFNICQHRGSLRTSAGFAEYDVVSAGHTYSMPEGFNFEVAALTDLYACAVHAIHRIPVSPADAVLILGSGPLAFALSQVARLHGAQTIMVGKRQPVLDLALQSDVTDAAINSSQTDVPEEVMKLTGGKGASCVFEAVGGTSSQTLTMAIDAAAPSATVGILGAFVGNVQIPYSQANSKEITLKWCNGYSAWQGQKEFRIALDLLAQGALQAGSLITHRFSLNEIARAFQVADDKATSGAVKVVLEPAG